MGVPHFAIPTQVVKFYLSGFCLVFFFGGYTHRKSIYMRSLPPRTVQAPLSFPCSRFSWNFTDRTSLFLWDSVDTIPFSSFSTWYSLRILKVLAQCPKLWFKVITAELEQELTWGLFLPIFVSSASSVVLEHNRHSVNKRMNK